ncbi:MAG: class I SAM-dependent methyltransferase [Ottowia sp.]|nr:class I SAM-dependent methyltransferase [Ottowia sp.]
MQQQLSGVPETMLWTLHNRASEAARPDGCIRDDKCLEIYRSIDYDYTRRFGPADGSHAVRAQLFDAHIRAFLDACPDGIVINLGEGLETQRYRIELPPKALWVTVDLPGSLEVRERFIQPDAQHWHIGKSAFDTSWFDDIPAGRLAFISAQGLLMYFRESELAPLFQALAQRFPGGMLMFDYVNVALSQLSCSPWGWVVTSSYRAPPMHWGIDRSALQPTLSRWIGQSVAVHNVTYRHVRGAWQWLAPTLEDWAPLVADKLPGICWLQLPARSQNM